MTLTGISLIVLILVGVLISAFILLINPKKYVLGFQDRELLVPKTDDELSQYEIN